MPPKDERAGHILLADSTIFTTLFGGTDSRRDLLEERCTHVNGELNPIRKLSSLPSVRYKSTEMDILSKTIPITMLLFVVSSMLAVGLSLTVGQIVSRSAI